VHVDGHGAEHGVADLLPLQRLEHPDHWIGLHRRQDSAFSLAWACGETLRAVLAPVVSRQQNAGFFVLDAGGLILARIVAAP
jgi:hypothetical protein